MERTLKMARPTAKLVEGRRDWYRIENSATASASDVYIYDEIGYFGVTAADFVRDFSAISRDQVTLHINSPGGDVFDGLAITNAIRDHRANVTVVVDGLAASAASFIAMAGDRVVMNRNSQMMIHDAHGLTIGNGTDMRAMADLLDKMSDNIADIYAKRAGGTQQSWRKAMQNETWYSADEAVKAGLADEVAGSDEARSSNSWDLSIYNFAGREAAPAPEMPDPTPEPQEEESFDPAEFHRVLQEVFHNG